MTSHFLTFQVGVSSNYRKFNLEDLLGKNLKNCSAKLPSQFWFWWKLMKIRYPSKDFVPFDPRMGSNRVVLGGQTQISLSNIDLLVKGSLCANFQTNLMRYNVLSHLTPIWPHLGGQMGSEIALFLYLTSKLLIECINVSLVKIWWKLLHRNCWWLRKPPPQSWQASQTSVWLGLSNWEFEF